MIRVVAAVVLVIGAILVWQHPAEVGNKIHVFSDAVMNGTDAEDQTPETD